jgi:hypothetical protein
VWMQTECCGDGGGCSCRVGRSCPWCDVELTLFIKVSSPFPSLSELGLPNIIKKVVAR